MYFLPDRYNNRAQVKYKVISRLLNIFKHFSHLALFKPCTMKMKAGNGVCCFGGMTKSSGTSLTFSAVSNPHFSDLHFLEDSTNAFNIGNIL